MSSALQPFSKKDNDKIQAVTVRCFRNINCFFEIQYCINISMIRQTIIVLTKIGRKISTKIK